MNFKKPVLIVSFLAIFSFLFSLNAPFSKAAEAEELQTQIQALLQQVNQLQQDLATTQGTTNTSWCYVFNINLRIGDKSTEVAQLKQALIKTGILSSRTLLNEEEFDEETASAVVEFQEKYASEVLTPYKLKRGTGFVGLSTRTKLNKLFDCAAVISSPTSCHTADLWSGNYCSISCKCDIGEGDCDSHYECNTGYCAYDVGKKYGQYPTIDVCEEKAAAKSITLTSPNGGEIWTEEETYDITWKSSGVEKVIIQIAKGSQSWYLSYDAPANLGKYSWQAKGVENGNDYKITIWDSSNAKINDSSNSYFTIAASSTAPSITLISPNGGEAWAFTIPYNITWKAKNIEKVDIFLEKWAGEDGKIYAGGPLTQTIDENVSASDGAYSWSLGYLQAGTIASTGRYYKIKIMRAGDISASQQIADSSDNYFSIVTPSSNTACEDSDSGLDYYAKGKVTWLNTGNIAQDYCVDSDTLAEYQCAQATSAAANPTKYDCPTGCEAGACKQTASVTLTSPNGAEKWEIGKTYNIAWTMKGLGGTAPINIFATNEESSDFEPSSKCTNLSTDEFISSSGYGYQAIFCGTAGFFNGTYKYAFTVPSSWTAGIKYKIDIVVPGANDTSDNYFSVVLPPSSPITSFNYTETDSYGGSAKFSWTSAGIDNIVFQLSCHQGLSINYAATGETFLCGANDRRLSPDSFIYLKFTNASGSPIDAEASLTPFIGGVGDGTKGKTISFKISTSAAASSIKVLSPNGGERWAIGNTYEITWQSFGVEKVNIDITSGSSAYTLASGVLASLGKYSWTIGAKWPYLFTGNDYKIRVFASPLPSSGALKEGVNYDQSNNYFSIVSTIPGSLSASLDTSSPASTNLGVGQTAVTFAKIKLTASINGDVNNMSAIQIGSDSQNASNYITNIKIYDGATQLGETAANLTYKGNYYYQWIYVSGVSIPASTTKVLTVVADIKSTADNNGLVRLGVAGLNFISPGASVLGIPVYGNSMAITLLSAPSITLTSPNGGQTWQTNYMYQVKWKSNNLPQDSQNRISISLFEKKTFETSPSKYLISVLAGTANDGSENISVPASITAGDYKVEVAYCPSTGTECTVKDSSDDYFSIVSGFTCADPDEKNYYFTGTCQDYYGTYTDICYDSSVKEYYCDSTKLCSFGLAGCSYGCENGMCKTGITE